MNKSLTLFPNDLVIIRLVTQFALGNDSGINKNLQLQFYVKKLREDSNFCSRTRFPLVSLRQPKFFFEFLASNPLPLSENTFLVSGVGSFVIKHNFFEKST